MTIVLFLVSLIVVLTLHPVAINDSVDLVENSDATRDDCIRYNRSDKTVKIDCNSANLAEIYTALDDPDILFKEGAGVWILNANILVDEGSTFYINSSDTSWLKINSTGGIAHHIEVEGSMDVDSVKITGWDTKNNAVAKTNETGKMPRSYIKIVEGSDSSAKTDIINSEISYLGYNTSRSFGLSYYAGANSIIKNNNIHNLWYGFYSANYQFRVHNITIENNHFHNNTLYGIDPHSGSHHLVIRNNTVNANGKHGIICSKDCYNILIEKNMVYDNFDRGIVLHKNITKSVIRNNTVDGNTVQIGIQTLSDNNEIYGNNISGGEVGIEISDGSGNNTIHHNKISGSDYGIDLLDPGTLNKVESNDIKNVSMPLGGYIV